MTCGHSPGHQRIVLHLISCHVISSHLSLFHLCLVSLFFVPFPFPLYQRKSEVAAKFVLEADEGWTVFPVILNHFITEFDAVLIDALEGLLIQTSLSMLSASIQFRNLATGFQPQKKEQALLTSNKLLRDCCDCFSTHSPADDSCPARDTVMGC